MIYSNCLIEALKAKAKDPAHIRVVRFPKVLTERVHFGWTDGEFLYHAYDPCFKMKNKIRRNLELIYKVKIKKIPFTVFEAYLCDNLKGDKMTPQKQRELLKKFGVRLADIPYTIPDDGWNWVFDDTDLPSESDVRYMEKIFRGKVFMKVVKRDKYMKVMTYEKLMKIKSRNGWGWRYVTQMDGSDFQGLYGYHIRVRTKEIQD